MADINNDIAIKVDHVSMKFNLNKEIVDSLKEYLIKFAKHSLHYSEFTALDDVSFEVHRGESIGIVGLNGSGKSTLLKVIAGVLKPTSGTVTHYGSIAPMIELGAGFNPNLSGRENIFLNAYLLGMNKQQIEDRMDEIIDFASLGEFLDVPVKNYSSGMKARLGFAISSSVRAPILIVDEVLAVGDFKFRQKCAKKMEDLLANNTTLLFVSHNKNDVLKLCDRCIYLEAGKLKMDDRTEKVFEVFGG